MVLDVLGRVAMRPNRCRAAAASSIRRSKYLLDRFDPVREDGGVTEVEHALARIAGQVSVSCQCTHDVRTVLFEVGDFSLVSSSAARADSLL